MAEESKAGYQTLENWVRGDFLSRTGLPNTPVRNHFSAFSSKKALQWLNLLTVVLLGSMFHCIQNIKVHIRNKADNFTWTLVAVYGVAQDEHKPVFLRELVNLAKDNCIL